MKYRSFCTYRYCTTVQLYMYLYLYLYLYVQSNAATVTMAPLRKKEVKEVFLTKGGHCIDADAL